MSKVASDIDINYEQDSDQAKNSSVIVPLDVITTVQVSRGIMDNFSLTDLILNSTVDERKKAITKVYGYLKLFRQVRFSSHWSLIKKDPFPMNDTNDRVRNEFISGLEDSNLIKLGDILAILRPSLQYAFAVSQDISLNVVDPIKDDFGGRFIKTGKQTEISKEIHDLTIAFEKYFLQIGATY